MATASPREGDDQVRIALAAAVRVRVGEQAQVRIDDLQWRGDIARPFSAQPTAGARTGTRVRFVLTAVGQTSTRVGEAEATVAVSAPHLRARRPLRRGTAIDADNVELVDGDVGSVPFAPLPGALVAGATAARDVANGDVLSGAALLLPTMVKSGDRLVVRVTAGAVSVQALMVAAQAGALGDVIRCVNPDTRKAMAARIVAPGLAEVIHAF